MTKEFNRTDRIAQMIQRKLALIIQQEIKDPRLPRFITVSEVVVAADLSHAKIYITVLGDKEVGQQTLKILNGAASYLRTTLARVIKLRTIPQLHFVYDTSLEEGNRLSKLIDQVAPPDDESA